MRFLERGRNSEALPESPTRGMRGCEGSLNKYWLCSRTIMIRSLVLICLLLEAAAPCCAKQLDVYILTGQSNSLGTTNQEAPFDPGTHPADAQTDLFWSNVFSATSSDPSSIVLYGDSGNAVSTLQMQQGDGNNPRFWGPEFGMARTLFDTGSSNVVIIKISRGGGGNSSWLPTTGHMYNHILQQADIALTGLQTRGDTFQVKGFMYLQGESNNASEAAAADTRLQALIDGVKSHINANYANAASDMYAVVGEIAASQATAPRMTTTNLQEALAASSSQIAFFRTRDQPLKSDGIHFGTMAKLEIGRRFGDAFNSQAWVEDPYLVAGYSAKEGGIHAIPHPIAQGLQEGGAGSVGVTMGEVNDGGIPAWRILDNSRGTNPEYRLSLKSADFQEMFDNGWTFKAMAKVISGGGSASWSVVGAANDPGWGIAGGAGNTIGFQLARVNGDELEVRLWSDQPAINLGPGSANQYHTLELRGLARATLFDFYIDGQLQSARQELTSGAGILGNDNALIFNSGSIGGTGREVFWSEVSLTILPEPSCSVVVVMIGITGLWYQRRSRANRPNEWPQYFPKSFLQRGVRSVALYHANRHESSR